MPQMRLGSACNENLAHSYGRHVFPAEIHTGSRSGFTIQPSDGSRGLTCPGV